MKRLSVWFGSIVLVSMLVSVMVLGCIWLVSHWYLNIPLQPFDLHFRIKSPMDVSLAAERPLDLTLDGKVVTQVPINQPMSIPLVGEYPAEVSLRTAIPLSFDVAYQGTIKVDTSFWIEDTTALVTGDTKWLPKFPLKIEVPLSFDVPIGLNIPVSTVIDFNYHGPMQLGLNHVLNPHINTSLNTQLDLNQEVTVPVLNVIKTTMQPPVDVFHTSVNAKPLGIKWSDISLLMKEPSP